LRLGERDFEQNAGVLRYAQNDYKNRQPQGQRQRQKQIPFGDDNQKAMAKTTAMAMAIPAIKATNGEGRSSAFGGG
jgi:hypothetical protein